MKITIREAALKRGKSLYRVAADLGIPHQTVYAWHNWNQMPNPDYLDALCDYLSCGIQEILTPDSQTMPVQRS